MLTLLINYKFQMFKMWIYIKYDKFIKLSHLIHNFQIDFKFH